MTVLHITSPQDGSQHLQKIRTQSPGEPANLGGSISLPYQGQALLANCKSRASPFLPPPRAGFCTHSAIYSLWQHSNLCLLIDTGFLPVLVRKRFSDPHPLTRLSQQERKLHSQDGVPAVPLPHICYLRALRAAYLPDTWAVAHSIPESQPTQLLASRRTMYTSSSVPNRQSLDSKGLRFCWKEDPSISQALSPGEQRNPTPGHVPPPREIKIHTPL